MVTAVAERVTMAMATAITEQVTVTAVATSVAEQLVAAPPAPAPPAQPEGNWICPSYANTDCWQDYQAGTILGRGGFGIVYKAIKKGTNEEYAVKMISKRKLAPEDIAFVKHEVGILHHLTQFGHPHIIEIIKVYEDKNYVCLVMPLCSGGELLEAIGKRGSYSERDAARMLHTIISVVAHCHRMGVIHRDIKPENFLLSDDGENATLKAIDFGLSQFFKEGQVLTELVGSIMYMAPEVINEQYGKEADLWSCGVTLYIILCGRPPFSAKTDEGLLEAIQKAPLDLESHPWPTISDHAKDVLRRLLDRDPRSRASAEDILQHPWLAENGVARSQPINLEVLTRLQQFAAADRLQREAMRLIAGQAKPEETQGVQFMWRGIKGSISKKGFTAQDFVEACRRKGVTNMSDEEIAEVFKQVASESSDGFLDFTAFAAATTNVLKASRGHWADAFAALDVDGDGLISESDLAKASQLPSSALSGVTPQELVALIQRADLNSDGTLDFEEFKAMLQGGAAAQPRDVLQGGAGAQVGDAAASLEAVLEGAAAPNDAAARLVVLAE